jgi:hypothetical protein
MAYVPIPTDLKSVKTKVAFNLTARQLVYFSCALIIGAPVFWLSNRFLDNSTLALLLTMAVAAPLIFFGMFEKDGLTGERYIKQLLKVKYKRPLKRYYKNTNYYRFLHEVINKEQQIEKEYKLKSKKKTLFRRRVS